MSEEPVRNMQQLRVRWLGESPDGGSLRDAALRGIREAAAAGHALEGAAADLRGISLAGEELSGADFSRCDLSGADFSDAKLAGAKFSWAVLRGATFCRAHIESCEFLAADLTGANLSEAHAERSGFGAARMVDANLLQARMSGATLSKADLTGADLRTADLQRARLCDAVCRKASFMAADLRGADLTGMMIGGASFNRADLRESTFYGLKEYESSTWVEADIRSIDFCGAYLVRRYIMDENYLHEFRTKSRFHGFLYRIWWLTSDCGRSFARWAAFTAVLALSFAVLYQLVDVDWGEKRGFLSSFYFSVVTLTTLGYGEITPRSGTAQVLAISEAVLGYVVLGGLLSILANKMARRAE